MEIIKQGKKVYVKGENVEMMFYISGDENSQVVNRISGTVNDTLLTVSNSKLSYRKVGKGKIKNESQVFEIIEIAEEFLRQNGYVITI